MNRTKWLISLPLLALASQAACVAKGPSATCTMTGAEILGSGTSAEALCSEFMQRLDEASSARGSGIDIGALAIAVEIDKRGTASARVTDRSDGVNSYYPVVSVDVMDRTLDRKDLDRLASALANMLADRQGTDRSR